MAERQLLLLAQVDDASGEVLAAVVDELLAAGAANVQLLPGVGKHGRPSHVLLVDAPAEREEELGLVLAAELGVWGYHVLEPRHRHAVIREERRPVTVVAGGEPLELEVGCKWIGLGGRVLRVKAEHRDLVALQAALRERGRMLPLAVLRARIEEEAWERRDGGALELTL